VDKKVFPLFSLYKGEKGGFLSSGAPTS